jgi:GPH family glycoside/pentoside/hexuronide:cation symporter
MFRFGAGQLGAQVFRDTPAVLLPIFMTTMLGVPAWLSGLVILGPKLWLIVCDPMMGLISDREKARIGRTPFLAAGAVLTSAGFLALFAVTRYASPLTAAIALCALFFAASTAFSMFSVPYLAVASELSSDPHERTRILTYRMAFATAGVVVGVGLAQPLIFHFGGGALGWRIMALAFSTLCLVSMGTTALGLRGVTLIAQGNTKARLLHQLSSAASNRPFVILLATYFIQTIGQACAYTVLGLVFIFVIKDINLLLPFVLVMSLCGVLSQPAWVALSRRFGKARGFFAASLSWTLITATWVWLKPNAHVLVSLPVLGAVTTEQAWILGRAAALGVLNTGFLLLALSMLTDTVDLDRQTGLSAHEGMFSGVFSAAEKLAFALGPVIAGTSMSYWGFVSSAGGIVAQNPRAILGLLLLYSLVPAALQILGLVVFAFYEPAMAARAKAGGRRYAAA